MCYYNYYFCSTTSTYRRDYHKRWISRQNKKSKARHVLLKKSTKQIKGDCKICGKLSYYLKIRTCNTKKKKETRPLADDPITQAYFLHIFVLPV